MGTREGVR